MTVRIALGIVAALTLAGCVAKTPPPPPVTIARVAPPPLVAPTRPQIPANTATTYASPPRDSYGKYVTPNGGLPSEEALWHLRMGLNVAALACYDATDGVNTAYGQFLTLHEARLAKANTAMDALWVDRAGKKEARTARDNHSVEVYNFFALPTITPVFCAAATRVLAQANALPSTGLDEFATVGLAELEAPFTDFFTRYDAYRVAAADWDQVYGRAPAMVVVGQTTPGAATTPFRAQEVTYDPVTNQPVTRAPTAEGRVPLDSTPTTAPAPAQPGG